MKLWNYETMNNEREMTDLPVTFVWSSRSEGTTLSRVCQSNRSVKDGNEKKKKKICFITGLLTWTNDQLLDSIARRLALGTYFVYLSQIEKKK